MVLGSVLGATFLSSDQSKRLGFPQTISLGITLGGSEWWGSRAKSPAILFSQQTFMDKNLRVAFISPVARTRPLGGSRRH